MHAVRLAGGALTEFGRQPTRTGRDLFAEAADSAFEDAGIPREDVERLFYGNFMGEFTEHQGHQGPLMAEAAGVAAPSTRVESACASGGVAVHDAVRDCQNGEIDVALVGGMERMTHLPTAQTTRGLAMAADDLYETRVGLTFPGAYALLAREYFDEFGGSRSDLAEIAVKNHANALPNSYAQFQKTISIDEVLEAPLVADPLGLYDACPVTDGAAALILVSDNYAASHDLEASISITGTGQSSDTIALQDRSARARTPATRRAASAAYDQAGIKPDDVDVAEVHDCFTIAEVLAIEGLGFFDHGKGIDAATNSETTRDGSLPVNLSGGLKAKGHPVGATGVSQLVELMRLFRGDHPNSDAVSDATVGVAHNAGGTVASAVVNVVEVDS